jgi:hypothetical protein
VASAPTVTGWKVGRKLRPLTDTQRDMVAAASVEHIRLCNWRVERGPPWSGFAELGAVYFFCYYCVSSVRLRLINS